MLTEIAIIGGLVGVVAGLLEVSAGPPAPAPRSAEEAIRAAMRGPESGAVGAEFRRRGVIPPSEAVWLSAVAGQPLPW